MRVTFRLPLAAVALVGIGACVSPTGSVGRAHVTTYYDGNGDGIVDYELHDIRQMADDGWALRDRDFDGRYDVRYVFGYVGTRSKIDQPVPRNVRITAGIRQRTFGFDRHHDIQRPNQAMQLTASNGAAGCERHGGTTREGECSGTNANQA